MLMLQWTGERYIPDVSPEEIGAEIHYEHLHRYLFTTQFVKNKVVLDLGCGEGYGSYIISKVAKRVLGIDIDEKSIKHASSKYIRENLEFLQGSATEIPIDGEEIFDVVVCFEVLEHISEHEKMLEEVKRVLKKEGIFIVSTPNKKAYSDDPNYRNPFHVKELYFDEFKLLLSKYFKHIYFFGQRIYPSSQIWSLTQKSDKSSEFVIEQGEKGFVQTEYERKEPMYFIAIASDQPLDFSQIDSRSFLTDISQTLIKNFQRYTSSLEGELGRVRSELNNLSLIAEQKEEKVRELKERLEKLEVEIRQRDDKISELENSLNSKVEEIESLKQKIESLRSTLNEKNQEIEKLVNELERLKKDLDGKEEQIRKLTEDSIRLSLELESIKSSVTWRAVMKWHSLVERIAPLGTRRRRWYDLGIRGLRILASYGLRHFLAEYRHFRKTKSKQLKDSSRIHYFERILAGEHRSWKLREEVKQKLKKTAVILPVYNQPDIVENCLRSLVKNTSGEVEIIAIDDSSPDRRVKEVLLKYSSRIKIFRNHENTGFVRTVNKGFELTKDKEIVIILNQDTEVPPLWVERLITPIVEDPRIASVTPMSNAATIMSFPEFCKDNEQFLGLNTEFIDGFFLKYGDSEPVEVPTAVGFCMAINRSVLDEVGYFDAETFGRGYGEENDWCMRAKKRGYKNAGITYLYVFHNHGSSFGPEKERLLRENLKRLRLKHPEYFAAVEDFIKRDPFKEIRDTVKLLIEANVGKRNVLVVTNSLGGGSEVYINYLKRALGNKLNFIDLRYDFRSCCWFLNSIKLTRGIEENATFKRLLEILNVDTVFVNQIVSHPDPLNIIKLIEISNKPYVFAFHDYFAICPNWNLVSPSGWFCGLNNTSEFCRMCLSSNNYSDHKIFYSESFDLNIWRESWREFLEKAKSVLFFSEASRKIVEKVYKLENGIVIEHYVEPLSKASVRNDGILTVGVLGAIGFPKGWHVVKKLAGELKNHPIRFVVIGVTAEIHERYEKDNLIITGRFRREELPKIVEEYNVDVVLIPSVWPETYSYTTTEAIMMGLPVIVFNMGAQAERVKRLNAGFAVNDYDELKQLIANINSEIVVRKGESNEITLKEWGEKYESSVFSTS